MKHFRLLFLLCALVLPSLPARAEWRTESYSLRPGWNAIYTMVDASYTTLDNLLAAYPSIVEVWRWQPELVDPRQPGNVQAPPVGVEWSVWKAGEADESTFTSLSPNYGYLVHVNDTAQPLTLQITGRAVIPEVRWRGDGLQLAGFPVIASGASPTFSSYLAPAGFSLGGAQILRYNGGPILQNTNPLSINPSVTRITRGQAYWINVQKFSRYYGPLSVDISTGASIDFGTKSQVVNVVLTNQTTTTLGVSISTVSSDPAPNGQPFVTGSVPLNVEVDAETAYTPLTSRTLSIPAGGVIAIRTVVNRALMGGASGNHFGSLLKLSTTTGLAGEDLYLPVTADYGPLSGLWIGEAQITQVGSVVLRYARDAQGNTVYGSDGKPQVLEDLTTPGSATTLPGVSTAYPLRVIMHVDASGQATLLSHVYQGPLAANQAMGLTLSESLLDATQLKNAVRLSVAHLPLDTALQVPGFFGPGGTLAAPALVTPYNSPVSPFVHIYHPDHDNLDAQFKSQLPAGRESFDIKRTITLGMDTSPPNGSTTDWGTSLITGTYSELLEGPYKSPIRVQGSFSLYKVSDISAITRQ